MIVRDLEDEILLIRQTDHAVQCGEFAAAWGNAAVTAPVPPAAVVLATAEHDNGWQEWEDAPRVDPTTGRPYQFFTIPIPEHVELYRRGILRVAVQDPYAGLLVSLHGLRLYGREYAGLHGLGRKQLAPAEQALVQRFFAEQGALQAELRSKLDNSDETAAWLAEDRLFANYKLLQAWDALSLYTLTRPLMDGLYGPVPLGGGDGRLRFWRLDEWTLGLDPYPFERTPLVTRVPGWLIPGRRYETDEELRRAWADRRPTTLTISFSRVT